MFVAPGQLNRLIRRLGMACAFALAALTIMAKTDRALSQPPVRAGNHAPGDAPSWPELKQFYDVDNNKDPVVKEEVRTATAAYSVHIVLTGPNGQQVPGGFLRPKADGVYPVILLLHGPTSSKDAMLKAYGIPLINHGFAVLALDAPFHGERANPEKDPLDTSNFGDAIHEGCREYRRAIDWLIRRKDIDGHRIGVLGYSLGAMMGAILGAVDDRVQDLVLCAGGDPIVSFAPNVPEGKRDRMYSISPSLFIGHIAPRRVLMLNSKTDTVMILTATLRLYDAAADPKSIEWYESDHILPDSHISRAVNWLTEKLNPLPVNP